MYSISATLFFLGLMGLKFRIFMGFGLWVHEYIPTGFVGLWVLGL